MFFICMMLFDHIIQLLLHSLDRKYRLNSTKKKSNFDICIASNSYIYVCTNLGGVDSIFWGFTSIDPCSFFIY